MTSNTDGRPALSNELIEQFSLHGRTAVITGAAGGIGRQAAITFTQAGANVVIADVGVAGLEETAEMVSAAGGNATVVPTDVSDRDQVNALADAAIKTHGRLDIWANVAGVIRYMNIVDATPEDVEFITKVNLWGTYWGVAAAGRAMTNGGSIINVSSAGGDMPAPTLSIYAMTKAAVSHLTRCAAVELGAIAAAHDRHTRRPNLGDVVPRERRFTIRYRTGDSSQRWRSDGMTFSINEQLTNGTVR